MSHLDANSFAASFEYRADARDRWTLLRNAPYRGDCEDFALTYAYRLSGNWLKFWFDVLTLRYVFWLCWARGDRSASHIALWVRGAGWIDNIYPFFGGLQHKKRWPLMAPALAIKLLFKGGKQA